MEVINYYGEIGKKEQYLMTRGQSQSMRDCVGEIIEPDKWMLYSETNSKNEEVEVLTIMTKDGEVYTTTSPTFKEEFLYIADLMDVEPYQIEVYSRTSKAGRTFISCTLV